MLCNPYLLNNLLATADGAEPVETETSLKPL